jgi:CRP-like cAMP-binding protein
MFASRNSDAQKWNVEERLKQVEIFSKLNDKQIRKLAPLFMAKRYAKGEVLIRKGDIGLGMFLIVSGRVEVFDTRDGNRVTLATLDPGKCVGEMSLMDARPRSAHVEAIEDTECLLITRDSFNGLTRRDPEVLWGIVPLLVDRLRHADKRLAELGEAQPVRDPPAGVVAVAASPGLVREAPQPPLTVRIEPATTTHDSADTGTRKTRKAKKKTRVKDVEDEDDEEEDDEDEDDADEGEKNEDSLLRSMTQLSTASFMFMSSAFLLGAQESLRFLWSRDSLSRSVSKNEEVVSSLTAHVEGRMNDETKRLFTEFQELMSSIMRLFER